MTETPDSAFMLTRIVELTRDLDLAHIIQEISAILLVAGIVAYVFGYWLRHYCWYGTTSDTIPKTGTVLIVVAMLGLVSAYLSIPLTEAELDSLVTAYEALYGPIPEGML